MRPSAILGRADRYLISAMLPKMAAALIVTLGVLLIERLLRLLDFITGNGADIGPVLTMMLNLLPHYMGLALPAAFCIGVLATLSKLSRENEIDVLEAAGWSLRRIGAPLLGCAVVFSLFSVLLFGVIQPYSRYAFNELRHIIGSAGWDGRIEQGVILEAGDGLVISASEVDPAGRLLYKVFVLQERDGDEVIITAERGVVVTAPDGSGVVLVLQNGEIPSAGGGLNFEQIQLDHTFDAADNPFRPRGGHERELTLAELWDEMGARAADRASEPRFAAEFHNRLVRAVSMIGIALIAIPLSVTRKRVPTWRRMALAVAILAIYDNLIKLAVGYAKLGVADPALLLWGACAVFNGIALWLFMTTSGQGAQGPIRSALRLLGQGARTVTAMRPRA
ncbi:MAG: LptF/LptG family permease [Pseudomonadota bacterium]